VLDQTNRLGIVDVDVASDDGILLRAMSHFDWALHNLSNIQRMHMNVRIDLSAQPKIFLIAPEFSLVLRTAAHRLSQPQITWIRYHALNAYGTPAMHFERVALP
jgi:hypothetical protein